KIGAVKTYNDCMKKCLGNALINKIKGPLREYVCCTMYSTRIVQRGREQFYVDPCEIPQNRTCCDRHYCDCIFNEPGGWNTWANGYLPGKPLLKCSEYAKERCCSDSDDYLGPIG